jgi:hypothetical protein
MFVGLGVSGVGPILHGISLYGYRHMDERMGLSWVVLQGALYIFGAFLYAVSITIYYPCFPFFFFSFSFFLFFSSFLLQPSFAFFLSLYFLQNHIFYFSFFLLTFSFFFPPLLPLFSAFLLLFFFFFSFFLFFFFSSSLSIFVPGSVSAIRTMIPRGEKRWRLTILNLTGAMAGEAVPGPFRYLGQLAPDLSCAYFVCGGVASVRHDYCV